MKKLNIENNTYYLECISKLSNYVPKGFIDGEEDFFAIQMLIQKSLLNKDYEVLIGNTYKSGASPRLFDVVVYSCSTHGLFFGNNETPEGYGIGVITKFKKNILTISTIIDDDIDNFDIDNFDWGLTE